MCLQFLVAADQPINPPDDPAVGPLGGIGLLPAGSAGPFRAFTKPYVHALWFIRGCGCGCARTGSRLRPALVALLEWALRVVPEVELFACQAGREGVEPTRRDWCMPTELLDLWEFEGRELLVIPRDAGPPAAADRGGM
jgi:hypothetical protein